MCLSPHEMSIDQIKEIVDYYTSELADAEQSGSVRRASYFSGQLENYTELLRERLDEAPAEDDHLVEALIAAVFDEREAKELVAA